MKLLNSAVMPNLNGVYIIKEINFETFCQLITALDEVNILESYIGYEQNIELIQKWTGVEVALNRDSTIIKNKDQMLIMRLNSRINPLEKGNIEVNESHFEFAHATFKETK